MTEINSVEELDALPEGSVVLDISDSAHQVRLGGWLEVGTAVVRTSEKIAQWGPFTVIHRPEPEPETCPEWALHDDYDRADEVMIPAWGLRDGDLLSTPDGWKPVNKMNDDGGYVRFQLAGNQHVLTNFDSLVVRRG